MTEKYILVTEKYIPKELCSLSIALKSNLPTPQKHFANIFPNLEVEEKGTFL